MQFGLEALPIDAAGLCYQFNAEPLKGFIELTDGLFFIDSFVTLQALDRCICGFCDCIGELRLPAASRPFEQKRLMEFRRKVNRRRGYGIRNVARSAKIFTKMFKR
jgi:hypothetical protein